MGWALRARE
jgi:hypothetical protein